jgi:hypothetical protein
MGERYSLEFSPERAAQNPTHANKKLLTPQTAPQTKKSNKQNGSHSGMLVI